MLPKPRRAGRAGGAGGQAARQSPPYTSAALRNVCGRGYKQKRLELTKVTPRRSWRSSAPHCPAEPARSRAAPHRSRDKQTDRQTRGAAGPAGRGSARPSRRTCDPRGPRLPQTPGGSFTASPAPVPARHRPSVTHRQPGLADPRPAPHSQPPPAFVAAAAEAFKALRRGEAGAAARGRRRRQPGCLGGHGASSSPSSSSAPRGRAAGRSGECPGAAAARQPGPGVPWPGERR